MGASSPGKAVVVSGYDVGQTPRGCAGTSAIEETLSSGMMRGRWLNPVRRETPDCPSGEVLPVIQVGLLALFVAKANADAD